MTTMFFVREQYVTAADAVALATDLLTFAEGEGVVWWYITDPKTWESLTPQQRHNIGLDKAQKLLADYLRRQADTLEGKS